MANRPFHRGWTDFINPARGRHEHDLPWRGRVRSPPLAKNREEKMIIERITKNYVVRYTIRERMIAGRLNVHVRAVIIGNGRKVVRTNSFYR